MARMTSLARILLFAIVAFAATAPCDRAKASNIWPLAFGMTVQDAADALGSPLAYVSGRAGSEIFVTVRDAGIPSSYRGSERIYLQFRRGRLTGWKGDWRMRYGQLF
jgi:hypothetical protein